MHGEFRVPCVWAVAKLHTCTLSDLATHLDIAVIQQKIVRAHGVHQLR